MISVNYDEIDDYNDNNDDYVDDDIVKAVSTTLYINHANLGKSI